MRRHIAMVGGKERVMKEVVLGASCFSSFQLSSFQLSSFQLSSFQLSSFHFISFHMFEEGSLPSSADFPGFLSLHHNFLFNLIKRKIKSLVFLHFSR